MKTLLIIILLLVVCTVSASDDSESEEDASTYSDSTSDESVEYFAPSIIDNELSKMLKEEDSTADVIVTMKDSTASVHKNIRKQKFRNRRMKLSQLTGDLKTYCSSSQRKLVQALESSGKRNYEHYESYWITNQMLIRNANKDDLRKLEEMDGSNIDHIKAVKTFKLDDKVEGVHDGDGNGAMIESVSTQPQWGVAKMNCTGVWAQGFNGTGVRVATIDTGVRYTHEALVDNFIGKYGWYDPSGKTLTPNDANGHGTHTMGTICGRTNGIGVAPGAEWMACKGCATASCSTSDLIACGQWTLCPTLPDGSGKDCSQAPDVVSCSWAAGTSGTFYKGIIDAWTSAGIVSFFANGNTGSACGSANYPATYINTMGLGATDINDKVAYFSSVGPTADNRTSPFCVAPGYSIVSAYNSSDTTYATLSGTSMACPHAAGVAALLLQSKPSLTINQIRNCMMNGSVPTVPKNVTCGSSSDNIYPNNIVGYGRLDAVQATAFANNMTSP